MHAGQASDTLQVRMCCGQGMRSCHGTLPDGKAFSPAQSGHSSAQHATDQTCGLGATCSFPQSIGSPRQ